MAKDKEAMKRYRKTGTTKADSEASAMKRSSAAPAVSFDAYPVSVRR